MLLYSISKGDVSFISLHLLLSTQSSCHVLCPTISVSEINITPYSFTKSHVYLATEHEL